MGSTGGASGAPSAPSATTRPCGWTAPCSACPAGTWVPRPASATTPPRSWPRPRVRPGAGGAHAGIRRDFAYRPGATSVRTTVDELLGLRAGVCQDFAHLAIAVLRSLGVPARYVSGYIETVPPPGKEKLEGSDASHAWVSALAPDGTWIDIDPTNGQFADSRYLVTAWGRDFGDVSPLRGIVETEGPARS
ncbi:transglutaminase-like domain-containing protein [Tessaracoccus coleopterorum]|uniref:transglutaminase-like domain-containing protein n=1 Tax=Tessaracoccus coleopterorum TaxID=2714950 RepID=UPI0018D49957